MNSCSYRLKTWVALLVMLASFLAVASGADTTLLWDGNRHQFNDWRTSASNRLHLLESRMTNIVVTSLTNGPGGIGLVIGPAPEGAVVKRVVPYTPAWQGGLHENDLIITVENQPVGGMALRDIAQRLRGPIGSVVDVTLLRPGQPLPPKIRLKREAVPPLPEGFRL